MIDNPRCLCTFSGELVIGIGYLTIASNDEELIVLGDIVSHNIWVCCHDLLLRSKVGALLELKIADGTRQCQIAVNSAEVDETASSTNSGFLT